MTLAIQVGRSVNIVALAGMAAAIANNGMTTMRKLEKLKNLIKILRSLKASRIAELFRRGKHNFCGQRVSGKNREDFSTH